MKSHNIIKNYNSPLTEDSTSLNSPTITLSDQTIENISYSSHNLNQFQQSAAPFHIPDQTMENLNDHIQSPKFYFPIRYFPKDHQHFKLNFLE